MPRMPALMAVAALMLATATAVQAAGDPAAGKEKSQTCASCHGEKGNSRNPMYPKLGGQHESYLYHALKAYKSGARENAVMAGMVSSLSQQDMRDLAAYFASIDGKLHTLPLESPEE